MDTQAPAKVLILVGSATMANEAAHYYQKITQTLGCNTPYEIIEIDTFKARWGSYDWQSEAFRTVFRRRYRKLSVWGWLFPEDREIYNRLGNALGWVASQQEKESKP